MYKISELIGKQAITLLDAENQGIILSAYFDKSLNRCKGFLLLSGDDDSRYFVDYKNCSSLTGDAVVIKSALNITSSPLGAVVDSPINLPAFNQDGQAKGIIRDIIMEDNLVKAFVTDEGEIEAGTLLSRSNNTAVFNDTGLPIKIKKPPAKSGGNAGGAKGRATLGSAEKSGATPGGTAKGSTAKSSSSKGRIPAQADDVSFTDSSIEDLQDDGTLDTRVKTPFRAWADGTVPNPLAKYSFLLGKRLQRSVYTDDGNLVVKEDELVTQEVIKIAKEHNKLVAVALHSL